MTIRVLYKNLPWRYAKKINFIVITILEEHMTQKRKEKSEEKEDKRKYLHLPPIHFGPLAKFFGVACPETDEEIEKETGLEISHQD